MRLSHRCASSPITTIWKRQCVISPVSCGLFVTVRLSRTGQAPLWNQAAGSEPLKAVALMVRLLSWGQAAGHDAGSVPCSPVHYHARPEHGAMLPASHTFLNTFLKALHQQVTRMCTDACGMEILKPQLHQWPTAGARNMWHEHIALHAVAAWQWHAFQKLSRFSSPKRRHCICGIV